MFSLICCRRLFVAGIKIKLKFNWREGKDKNYLNFEPARETSALICLCRLGRLDLRPGKKREENNDDD